MKSPVIEVSQKPKKECLFRKGLECIFGEPEGVICDKCLIFKRVYTNKLREYYEYYGA